MQVSEAKAMVTSLIERDLGRTGALVLIDTTSPDSKDPGKFAIDGRVARVVHHFSGWHPHINLTWFDGSHDQPVINGTPFYWYAFAIPRLNRRRSDHYFICDYLQMREWVLEFGAPKGDAHRNHADWRADFRVRTSETSAYFRWGDEALDNCPLLDRELPLDNVQALAEARLFPQRPVGIFGPGGESAAHKSLKLYIATRPGLLGLSVAAEADIEHSFCTGDRVDVLFNNHEPARSVVEVEVAGLPEIKIGIHQAIKYRSLAEAQNSFPMHSPRVRAHVVAYETGYPEAMDLASRYDVGLLTVDRRLVLGLTS